MDKYQGQQNDIILLSLVRTKTFGHLRDVRRLVVATSRSRLGLYIVGRGSLFSNCHELQPTFKQLMARPVRLALVKGESYGLCHRRLEDAVEWNEIGGIEEMGALVDGMAWEWQMKQSQMAAAALQGNESGVQDSGGEAEGGERQIGDS